MIAQQFRDHGPGPCLIQINQTSTLSHTHTPTIPMFCLGNSQETSKQEARVKALWDWGKLLRKICSGRLAIGSHVDLKMFLIPALHIIQDLVEVGAKLALQPTAQILLLLRQACMCIACTLHVLGKLQLADGWIQWSELSNELLVVLHVVEGPSTHSFWIQFCQAINRLLKQCCRLQCQGSSCHFTVGRQHFVPRCPDQRKGQKL